MLPFQIRSKLPDLKAIVQYRGRPREQYRDVYNVRSMSFNHFILDLVYACVIVYDCAAACGYAWFIELLIVTVLWPVHNLCPGVSLYALQQTLKLVAKMV